jgi:hypothetical protein
MKERWHKFWLHVNNEIGSFIFLVILLYADILNMIETKCKNFLHRMKIKKIHKENPEITELTKLAGIKQPD